ncbi:GNAT family N-acetyltransferase [Amycolatopsis sp.]|uniref:GNAT family N-acetyltransferase n=1 Tax=Amycolatopsis sp. TaxID=37632 RepID=UPI002DFE8E05|nr:GNAT family N-acetyltransferase [Amycolatopsis sp.]
MSDIEIRPARAEEFATIGEVTVEAYTAGGFLGENAEPAYENKLRDSAARAEHAELIAAVDADGTVLGSVTVVHPGTLFSEVSREGELEFRMLAVRPSVSGRGIGAALTGAVLDRAREVGAHRVVMSSLDIMTTAHRMYERLGFTRLPDRDWSPAPGVHLVAYTHAL